MELVGIYWDKMSEQPPPKKIKLEENSEDMSEVLLLNSTESSFNDNDVIVQPSSDVDQDPLKKARMRVNSKTGEKMVEFQGKQISVEQKKRSRRREVPQICMKLLKVTLWSSFHAKNLIIYLCMDIYTYVSCCQVW